MTKAPSFPKRAKITLPEKAELFFLGIIYLVGFLALCFNQNQLLTKVPSIFTAIAALVAFMLSFRLNKISWKFIIWRHEYSFLNKLCTLVCIIIISILIFYSLSVYMISSFYFRNGGKIETASYPIDHLVKPGGRGDPAILISPYGRTTRIPVSAGREQQISAKCSNDECNDSGLCVDVPIQRASNDAVRVLINDRDYQDLIPVKPCKDHP